MKYYYAIINQTSEAIEVEFPDLAGCVTFGENWDEAIDNATDVLAGWLTNAESKFIQKASSYEILKKRFKNASLIPIPIDQKIVQSYENKKGINVAFPSRLLKQVDRLRKATGIERSELLRQAVEEYLQKHQVGV
ncbi:MAG: type II toxin-antitoxin system HicB family antitoxin [bacterium]